VTEQGGAAAGGSAPSANGGAASSEGAGAGGDSHTAAGASSVAGSGAIQAGASAGGAGNVAGAGGVAGGGGVAGVGGGAGTGGTGEDPNKIVLFDGSPETFSNWYPRFGGMNAANPWINNGDGTMTVKYGIGGEDIVSKTPFTNVFVHLEYWSPQYDYPPNTYWQSRANSGALLKGSYEVQILDTFGLAPDVSEDQRRGFCGAIYYVSKPLVSACKPAGEWNAYDIEFRAEVCENGVKTTNAEFVEVKLNGILVQQHVTVDHPTQAAMIETCQPRGVLLQETGGTVVPVSFRNIWAIPRN
jgi:hypothetical protein